MDKNRFSIGFRSDGNKEKYFGFRKDYDHQYEASVRKIVINGKELSFDSFSKIEKLSDYELKHSIADGIWIYNRIHECYVQEAVVIDTGKIHLEDVEVWYELHLKGFRAKGKKAEAFSFELDTKEKIFVPGPRMWVENAEHANHPLCHRIVKKDGKIFYVKYLDDKAKNWVGLIQKHNLLLPDGKTLKGKKTIYIDSTTYYTSTADGQVNGAYSGTWSTARATGNTVTDTATSVIISTTASFDKQLGGNGYSIRRGFFYFDTSGLPDNATVTSADFSLYKYSASNSPTICAQKGTQGSSLSASDFTAYSGSSYGNVSTSSSGYLTISLDSAGKSDISKTGITKICVREYTYDYLNTAPSMATAYSVTVYSAEQSGTSQDPKLVIDYTESQNLSDTVEYTGKGAASSTGNITYAASVTSTGAGSVAVTPGITYAATATCTGAGTITVTQTATLVSLVSYTSYATITQQDVDSDIELITAVTAATCTVTVAFGYNVTITYSAACSVEESDNRIYSETVSCTGYGQVGYSGATSFSAAVNFSSAATPSQQDQDIDLEVILVSSKTSITIVEPTSYSAEIAYGATGDGSITANFNEVEEISFGSSGTSEAESLTALHVTIEYVSVGTAIQQDVDSFLETVTAAGGSLVAIITVTNYSVTYDGPTGKGQCAVTIETNKIVDIDYTATASIEVSTITTYGLTIRCEALATPSQQDEDIDLEVILCGSGAAGWISDFDFIRCNGAGSVQVLTVYTYDGAVEYASESSFEVAAITEYHIGIEAVGVSLGVSQDIDYDVEVILCGSSGQGWIQDIELLKIIGAGTVSVTTVTDYAQLITFEGLGSSEVLALKTWKDTVTFEACASLEVDTDYGYVRLVEFTGYGSVVVLDADVDIELITVTGYVSSEVIATDLANIEIQSAAYFTIDVTSTGRTELFWSIHVDDIVLEDNYTVEYAKFTDEKGKRSDYFEIVLNNNDGSLSEEFGIGDNVYLYFDENNPPVTKIFHGLITGIDFDIDSYGSNKLVLSGEDYGSVRFGQTIVSGAEVYYNTTATDIITDLVYRYCPEISTTNVEEFLDQIPFVSFAWEYVSQAIEKIARLVGADYYVDENDDLHFYDPSDLEVSHSITPAQIVNASIKRDTSKFFDRVFVVGGKQGFLDQSQATTTTEVTLHDKYYASSFQPSKSNVLYVETYVKKVGSPLDAFRFSIVEDNSGPTGAIVGFGSTAAKNVSTDGSWIKLDYIDVQLNVAKLHWIVFHMIGTATDTYKVAHDNTTASGHKYSTGSSWTSATGKMAFKTYYGVQIVKGATGTKMFSHHTDIPIVDLSIKDTDTALMLAQQKIIEYALSNSSKLTINPPGKRLKAGEVVSISIPGVTLEDQAMLSVSYEINDPKISTVRIECTAAEDFFSTFANLFSELRKLKVENVLQLQETSTDYKETTETPSIALTETITALATDYDAQFDDGKAKWDVSKWK